MVKTSDCGSDMHGFESHQAPHFKSSLFGSFLCNGADKTHQGKPLKELEHEAAEGGGFTTKRRRVFLHNAGIVVAC